MPGQHLTVLLPTLPDPHSAVNFDVKGTTGITLFHINVIRPHEDVAEEGPQEYVLLFLPDQRDELAMCTITLNSRGKWEGQVYRSESEHFGTLSEDQSGSSSSPEGKVFTLNSDHLSFQHGSNFITVRGDPKAHWMRVLQGGAVIASVEPSSVIFGPSAHQFYQVTCHAGADVVLVILTLLGMERLLCHSPW